MKEIEQLEQCLERLKKATSIYQLELGRISNELARMQAQNRAIPVLYEDGKLEVLREDVLKITVPEYPGRYADLYDNKGNLNLEAIKQSKDSWFGYIGSAVKIARYTAEASMGIPWDSAFVFVSYYMPENRVWDVDNRATSIIINALTRNGIVKKDSWDCLSFAVQGFKDKVNPRTEILIIRDKEYLLKALSFS
ncbi:hypothetical protein F9B85_09975 [Heliorestis acidaminivorans]|uniref:Uncharacterized protein n=1 Tax=Heliorestis acidaminivorans TaxID=553427 RepID=A0A6I0F4J2_9FIRM|nr:hypothetical protein [Heliorestis acidaminivorans]KAB2952130.1 hypothetical protein F9B85_09975 [Heliorestis acidaminivorans]